MSDFDDDDRWSDDYGRPGCPYCGGRTDRGWLMPRACATCENPPKPVEVPDDKPPDNTSHYYEPDPVKRAETLKQYIALTTAFDKAQEEERKGGAVDGVAVQEVREPETRPAVHDVWNKAAEGLQESESDMKRGDAFPGKHLKADDFPTGTRVSVVVDHVSSEVVGSGKDAEEKAVCYFRGKEKGLVLNQTNWSMLEGITGEEDSDNWNGTQCILYRTTTQFGGKVVPALRLDPIPLGRQTARTVQGRPPVMNPPPLPPTLPPPADQSDPDDYQISDDDVPF